ncbi:YacL family protein [Parashewanella spongiae]|nr:YacL family protein [Parashewanella spongiae]MCL1079348.1 YacL family protein [Parashewanella spongiae]
MDYEFRNNSLEDSVVALFSMEHQAVGRWFTEEIAKDKDKLSTILSVIEHISKDGVTEKKIIGKSITLELSYERVLVYENCIQYDNDYLLEEDMNLYDEESIASCGLEDFRDAMLSYQEFIFSL